MKACEESAQGMADSVRHFVGRGCGLEESFEGPLSTVGHQKCPLLAILKVQLWEGNDGGRGNKLWNMFECERFVVLCHDVKLSTSRFI